MYSFDRPAICRSALARAGERGEQNLDPLGRLGMGEGRMEARERRMTQDVDRRSYEPRAEILSARAFSPRSRTKDDASAQFGV